MGLWFKDTDVIRQLRCQNIVFRLAKIVECFYMAENKKEEELTNFLFSLYADALLVLNVVVTWTFTEINCRFKRRRKQLELLNSSHEFRLNITLC